MFCNLAGAPIPVFLDILLTLLNILWKKTIKERFYTQLYVWLITLSQNAFFLAWLSHAVTLNFIESEKFIYFWIQQKESLILTPIIDIFGALSKGIQKILKYSGFPCLLPPVRWVNGDRPRIQNLPGKALNESIQNAMLGVRWRFVKIIVRGDPCREADFGF
jgi:hypothetical protein